MIRINERLLYLGSSAQVLRTWVLYHNDAVSTTFNTIKAARSGTGTRPVNLFTTPYRTLCYNPQVHVTRTPVIPEQSISVLNKDNHHKQALLHKLEMCRDNEKSFGDI